MQLRTRSLMGLRLFTAAVIVMYYIAPNDKASTIAKSVGEYIHITASSQGVISVEALGILLAFVYCIFRARRPQRQLFLTTLFVIYLLTVALTGIEWGNHVQEASNCSSILSSMLMGSTVVLLAGNLRSAVYILIVAGGVEAGSTIFSYSHGRSIFYSGDIARAIGTYSNPNELYFAMVVSIPLAVGCAVISARNRTMIWCMVASALCFAACVLTWQRSAVLALGSSITYIARRTTTSKWLWVLVLVLFAGLGLVCVKHRSSGRLGQQSSELSLAGRQLLWERAFKIFEDHWLGGVGAGGLEIPVVTKSVQGSVGLYRRVDIEPKNLPLHWLAEMGIGGGVLLLLLLIEVYGVCRRSQSPMAVYVQSAWISMLVCGFFDTPFGVAERPSGNLLFAMLIAITVSLPVTETEKACSASAEITLPSNTTQAAQ